MVEQNVDLSKHRLERAKDDLEASKLLVDNNKFSQSINRSYYAIFHAARALLALENFDSKKHSGIISYFNKNFIKTRKLEKRYSKILMDAQDFRTDSDYDDFFVVSKEEAVKQLEDAAKFVEKIEIYIEENY